MRLFDFLNEQKFDGSFYFETSEPLNVNKIHFIRRIDTGEAVADLTIDKTTLARYKKNLSKTSASSKAFNYIYEIKNIMLLNYDDDKEIKNALNKNILIDEFSKEYEQFKKLDNHSKARELVGYLTNEFVKHYDGICSSKKTYTLIIPEKNNTKIFSKIKLIDGNAIRFGENDPKSNEFTFVEWVKLELLRYTNDAKKKLNTNVTDWLKVNAPKPYKTKKVYRAVGIQFDDWGDYNEVSVDSINKKLKKWFGINNMLDVKLRTDVTLKRGKESSWSTDPRISRNFASGMAENSLNILFEANIDSSDVIIDFTEISKNAKRDFPYRFQNEVIINSGPIKSKIIGLWAEKRFINWLNENGYTFSANTGIMKK